MPEKKKRPSLGSGLAERAAKALEGRQAQLDRMLGIATGRIKPKDEKKKKK